MRSVFELPPHRILQGDLGVKLVLPTLQLDGDGHFFVSQ